MGQQLHKALLALHYSKLLKLNITSLSEDVKHADLPADIKAVLQIYPHLPFLIISPISSIIAFILLSIMLEPVWPATLCLLILIFFILIPLSVWMFHLRLAASLYKRTRLAYISQLVDGILMIKSLAWEQPIIRKIEELWRREYSLVKRYFCGMSVYQMFSNYSSILLWIPSLLHYLIQPYSVRPTALFPALGLLILMGRSILQHFFTALRSLSDFFGIVLKLQDFLLLNEPAQSEKQTDGPRVIAHELSVSWQKPQPSPQDQKAKKEDEERNLLEQERSKPVFSNLSFQLDQGEHLAILGDHNSGKSTLLASIIGQTQILDGVLCVNGSLAYVGQTPLIFSDSIRNNIAFGRTLDERRLREVIRVCELREELKQLPDGILTQIGKVGVKISDSMRARIALARAIYSDQDIYLLDSIFGTMQTQVAQKVFEKCIQGYLKLNTVILINQEYDFLQKIGKILVLNRHQPPLLFQSFLELERNENFKQIATTLMKNTRQVSAQEEKIEEFTSRQRVSVISSISDITERRMTVKGPPRLHKQSQQLQMNYSSFFNTKGWCCSVTMILFSLIPVVIQTLVRLWFALVVPPHPITTEITVSFVCILAGWLIVSMISGFCLYYVTIRATSQTHSEVIHNVAHSPISFFDTTPVSRIISVFSNDLDILQFTHPLYISLFINIVWICVSWIFTSIFAFPYLAISLAMLCILLTLLLIGTIPIITRCLYFEENSRNVLESRIADTYSGLLSIKAYNLQDHFLSYFLSLVDNNSSAILTYNSFSAFLGLYTNLLSTLYTFTFLAYILAFTGVHSNPWFTSLGLVGAVLLNEPLHQFTYYLACLFSQLTKVHRVKQFQKLVSEPRRQYSFFAGEWPSKGRLYFHNIEVMNERNQLPLLKGVSFQALPGQKIGVIGDRDVGNSVLLQTLLSIKQMENGSVIAIDGINIAEVDLHTLRSSISIIPQTPFFVDTSLRQNIDPYFDFTDKDIWNALDKVGLRARIASFPGQLNEKAGSFEQVLSPLEKQFLYLGRAILKNNRILVVDEPSGGESRNLLQAIDQEQRRNNWTVLIFAQTIDSIIQADSVLVLSSGEALQFAHPYNLLQESEGLFANMVNALEPRRRDYLRDRAHSAYMKQHGRTLL